MLIDFISMFDLLEISRWFKVSIQLKDDRAISRGFFSFFFFFFFRLSFFLNIIMGFFISKHSKVGTKEENIHLK